MYLPRPQHVDPRHHSRGHVYYPQQQHAEPRWSYQASYAPGYTIYPLKSGPPPPIHQPANIPVPQAATHVREVPVRPMCWPAPQRPVPRQLRRKVSIPKKQVHFNLPPHSTSRRQAARKPSHEEFRRPTTPAHSHGRHAPQAHHRPSTHTHPHHRPSRSNLRHQPSHRNLRQAPASSAPSSSQPTIHILTYAHTLARSDTSASKLLAAHLPHGTAHLYTIRAYTFTPPPPDLCKAYSGVSPIIQDYVMRDSRAQKAVADAIEDILAFSRREKTREREGRGPARKDLGISVCCMEGTHRSVSIAERIAQGLMGLGLGVRVKVRHVHRVIGLKDPY